MKNVVGVKFKKEGKVYTFHAADLPLRKGDPVVVITDNGPAIGTAVTEVRAAPLEQLPANLKDVLRVATEEDFRTRESNQKLEREAMQFCVKRIAERQLPMKMIDVECLLTGAKCSFRSPRKACDFRDLVKDLVQRFRTRTNSGRSAQGRRRGSSRGSESADVRGLPRYASVQPRPGVGQDGQRAHVVEPRRSPASAGLMCCLSFEYERADLKRDMPKCGRLVQTAEGRGKVIRQKRSSKGGGRILEQGKETTLRQGTSSDK